LDPECRSAPTPAARNRNKKWTAAENENGRRDRRPFRAAQAEPKRQGSSLRIVK